MKPDDRPSYTGGAVQLSPTPHAFALRILDGLRRQLGRTPTGEDIRGASALLEATRGELARAANDADRRVDE